MNKPYLLMPFLLAVLLNLMLVSPQTCAAKLRIAVASNFALAMDRLAHDFESKTDHQLLISSQSTGKHYAQIQQGAPFDLFFAADSQHPLLLEQQGLAQAGSRFTYALGKLVLWSPILATEAELRKVLQQVEFNYLAIANPKVAPYGRATKQVLQHLDLWDKLPTRMVRGENIGQTLQFIHSGNAQLGFIAQSQLAQLDRNKAGSYWQIPQSLYSPIEQQMVLLVDSVASREFMAYIKTPSAAKIIHDLGYGKP
jgi:molybdate transport system substrate-binding protein